MDATTLAGLVVIAVYAAQLALVAALTARNTWGLADAFFRVKPPVARFAAPRLDDVVAALAVFVRFVQLTSFSLIDDLRPDETRWQRLAEAYDWVQDVADGFQGLYPGERAVFFTTYSLAIAAALACLFAISVYNSPASRKWMRRPVLYFNLLVAALLFLPMLQVMLRPLVCEQGRFLDEECWGTTQLACACVSAAVLIVFVPFCAIVGPLVQIVPEVNRASVFTKPAFVFLLVQADVVVAVAVTFFAPLTAAVEPFAALGVSAALLGANIAIRPTGNASAMGAWRTGLYGLQIWSCLCALASFFWFASEIAPLALLVAGWAAGLAAFVLFVARGGIAPPAPSAEPAPQPSSSSSSSTTGFLAPATAANESPPLSPNAKAAAPVAGIALALQQPPAPVVGGGVALDDEDGDVFANGGPRILRALSMSENDRY
jgi:hypothetical protein